MSGLIAIDWGTSSFRAYRLNKEGIITARISTDRGILSVTDNGFESVLREELAVLDNIRSLPIICSGMITSKQGWVETPYIECPAGEEQLAAALTRLDIDNFDRIYFVPGVKQLSPEPDIMRGEETQLVGIDHHADEQLYLLPGTHSKWVKLKAGKIISFSTFMTGDIYQALLSQTILHAVAGKPGSIENFKNGVIYGYTETRKGRGLLSRLFNARVQSILEIDPQSGTESYISGILLGTEIAEAHLLGFSSESAVTIIGSETLTELYETALKELQLKSVSAPADIAAHGLFLIARRHNLI